MRMAVSSLCVALPLLLGSTRQEQPSASPTVATLPPVVVETSPRAGSTAVDPGLSEVRVTFSKQMMDQSWSWSTAWEGSSPEITSPPRYVDEGRTCVVRVKLEPGRTYGWWLNSRQFGNFKDRDGRAAVPYLLTFETAAGTGKPERK